VDTLSGEAGNDQISGDYGNDTINGGIGDDILTGGPNTDLLTGGGGNDTFIDTKANLSGDTITDLSIGDKIIFSDATLAGFAFNLSGNTLTYTGGSLTLTGGALQLAASAASGGGVQLLVQAIVPLPINDVRNDFNGDGRSDILWRSTTGQLSDWLGQANGGFIGNDANASTNVPTIWHVQPEAFIL
ncbi:MAG: hypothetical protein ABIU10_04090, partial [Sphingomicrobium sp.]